MSKVKDLVDIATGILDQQGYLEGVDEVFVQELCEELSNAFSKCLLEEENE